MPIELPTPERRYYAVPSCNVIVDVELDSEERVKTIAHVFSMGGKRLTRIECSEGRLDEIHQEINRGKLAPVDWVPAT